ncbi:hypothetical protein MAR_018231, partial [Mya arenaria]
MLSSHLQKKIFHTSHGPESSGVYHHEKRCAHCDATDLLRRLVYHYNRGSHDLFSQPEPKKSTMNPSVWDIKVLLRQMGPKVSTQILFMHAIFGCDTTHLYDIGKGASLKHFIASCDLREQSTVFGTPSASTTDVVAAGENALVYLYSWKPGRALNSLQNNRLCEKVATSISLVQSQSLPPTSAAEKYQSPCVLP